MALSSIQWTDYTFNPWLGCRKVAPECANCYAETLDRNRYSKTLRPGTKENPVSHWGSGPRHRTKTWGEPVKWNRAAASCRVWDDAIWTRKGHIATALSDNGNCVMKGTQRDVSDADWIGRTSEYRPRVFCASLADWLDDENVPIQWFADLLKLIHDTPNLDWLLLTKRPQNFAERMEDAFRFCTIEQPMPLAHSGLSDPHFLNWMTAWHVQDGCEEGEADKPPANVWIGVSAGADQAAALAIPAHIHFLSCEPMLHELDETHAASFDWIIFGGESGSKARRLDVDWIEDGVRFCREHGITPFVKQLGSQPHIADASHDHGWGSGKVDWEMTGRIFLADKHGGEMDEWPEDLRVREFPTTALAPAPKP